MLKKLTSIVLAVMLMLSVATVAFSAEEVHAISFDTGSTNWEGYAWVAFHIWEIGGDSFYDWNAKKQRGTDADGDGVWYYDLDKAGVTLEEGSQYGIIFYTDKGQQTYNLLFDTTCYGDVAYCDYDNVYENPEDSSKSAVPAFWTNQDPAVNGPQLVISSIGNVVGTCCASNTTPAQMLEEFLANTLENAREYSVKEDQQLIDDIGLGLGLGLSELSDIIAASGLEIEWNAEDSTVPEADESTEDEATPDEPVATPDEPAPATDDEATPDEPQPAQPSANKRGDADMDGMVTILDATRIQRVIAELDTEDKIDKVAADADKDGQVTILDATRIQRVLADLCNMDGGSAGDRTSDDAADIVLSYINYAEDYYVIYLGIVEVDDEFYTDPFAYYVFDLRHFNGINSSHVDNYYVPVTKYVELQYDSEAFAEKYGSVVLPARDTES